MKIRVENLGVLKKAEFELGDLTLILGHNNTGKTYATYALFGFLYRWHRERLLQVDLPGSTINDLLGGGITRVNVEPYVGIADRLIEEGCKTYTRQLYKIFGSKQDLFKNTTFRLELDLEMVRTAARRAFKSNIRTDKDDLLTLSKDQGEMELVVTLLMGKETLPIEFIRHIISNGIIELLFSDALPRPFVASTQRTGAAIFRKELDFTRSRLLKELIQTDELDDPMELLFKSYQDYPLPVEVNVEFIRRLETIAKEESFILENHQDLLNEFTDIVGGEYIAESNDTVYFKPTRRPLRLTMNESSSSVRSLLDIGFYLRHVAKRGDLLIVDEPELNLHPKNQRRIARLFSRLVNLGIRVFVTTHSDYLAKELNLLIMLNQDKPYVREIADKEGYRTDELIAAERIRVYVAETALTNVGDNRRRSRHPTLVPAKIDPEMGIEAHSFDDIINKMNEIQDAVLWGGEE